MVGNVDTGLVSRTIHNCKIWCISGPWEWGSSTVVDFTSVIWIDCYSLHWEIYIRVIVRHFIDYSIRKSFLKRPRMQEGMEYRHHCNALHKITDAIGLQCFSWWWHQKVHTWCLWFFFDTCFIDIERRPWIHIMWVYVLAPACLSHFSQGDYTYQ